MQYGTEGRHTKSATVAKRLDRFRCCLSPDASLLRNQVSVYLSPLSHKQPTIALCGKENALILASFCITELVGDFLCAKF